MPSPGLLSTEIVPPWIGYLAIDGDTCIGSCGFNGPASEGVAEIAYFTFHGHEGRGVATRMAQALTAAGGVQVRAAELIGMPLRTFVLRLKQYGVPGPRKGGARGDHEPE